LKGLSVHKEEIETLANEYRKGNRKRLEEMASRRAKLDTELAEIDTEKEKLYQWLMKNKPTDDGKAYLENKTSEISRKDGEIKKELMLLDDRMTDIRTLSVSGEIVTKNLTDFVKTYDGLEPGEKKLLIESVVRLVEVKEGMNIRISLQVPLEKFRVFIPRCVPKETNDRNSLMMDLKYCLKPYYTGLVRTTALTVPFAKKSFSWDLPGLPPIKLSAIIPALT
jgi:hypothetical protein